MLSVIIPARNEVAAIGETIEAIRRALGSAEIVHEIIVVDDGSTDETGAIARAAGVRVIRHASSGGYGRSLKDGVRAATYDIIGITDADGTYPNDRMPELFRLVTDNGFDMAVGARTGKEYRGTFMKMPARRVFLWLSEYATGQKIDDINSGLRIFRKEVCLRYIHTISNGFSFTTTITLASMLNGYFVCYVPITYFKRVGASHVRYWRDSLRTMQIIIENILYYNPLKLFLLAVNTQLLLGALAIIGVVMARGAFQLLFAVVAGVSVPAALIIGAIGLNADLNRFVQRADRTESTPP
jgi:glycosyltransferase involved in cell wall biosynthesis